MMNKSCVTFCQKLFRSNDHFSKKTFGQMNFRSNDLSVKWPFFEKSFRSNEISVKRSFFEKSFWSNELPVICHFGHLTSFSSYNFGQMTIFQIFSVKRLIHKFVFGQMTFFGKMNFQSNSLRLNGNSVRCTFDQMAFGLAVFGQMVFRSNGLSVTNFRRNDFSVK
jgi:hypothetical protein